MQRNDPLLIILPFAYLTLLRRNNSVESRTRSHRILQCRPDRLDLRLTLRTDEQDGFIDVFEQNKLLTFQCVTRDMVTKVYNLKIGTIIIRKSASILSTRRPRCEIWSIKRQMHSRAGPRPQYRIRSPRPPRDP